MDHKKVSIITLTYNQLNKTKQFMDSLYKYTDSEFFELIVIDNHSKDGTKNYLKSLEKEKGIRLICNDHNMGYARGNNQGLRMAEGEMIGLLNNDILLSPRWLENVIKTFEEHKDAGLVSPVMLIDLEESSGISCRKENYMRFGMEYAAKAECSSEKFLYPQFSCVFLKRELLDTVGYLDEKFTPAFYEDDDYTIRTWRKGYNCYICNRSFYFHDHSATSRHIHNSIMSRNEKYLEEKDYLAYKVCMLWNENIKLKKEAEKTLYYKVKRIVKKIIKKPSVPQNRKRQQ